MPARVGRHVLFPLTATHPCATVAAVFDCKGGAWLNTFAALLAALPPDQIVTIQGDGPVSAPVVEADAEIAPGGVFVARRGLSVDGHIFIPRALAAGAAAVVGERSPADLPGLTVPYAQVKDAAAATGYLAAAYHGFPARRLRLIGVTGTDGKTTTSTLIHSVLRAASGGKAGLISTVYADLGATTADTGLHVTTPSAPQVQALLAQMVAHGLEYAVLEMTSHGLAQGRLNGVDIDVAVLTNITHEHLDYHGTFENYRAAKGRLFAMLAESAHKGEQPKVAVINADDAQADFFAAYPADTRWRYGLGETAPLRAEAIRHQPDGTYFEVVGAGFPLGLMTPLVGRFNVLNCLAAVGAARAVGVDDPAALAAGIAAVRGIAGRMERIDAGQTFTAIVDFAHTPNALAHALEAGRGLLEPGGRLIAVFGSAGLRDREKRRLMAAISARLADVSIFTAEDPRTESLADILATMAAAARAEGAAEGTDFLCVPDRGEALLTACQMARPGDLVIACGKGHEQSMCFGTVEYPWDDRDALRAALNGAPLRTLPTANVG